LARTKKSEGLSESFLRRKKKKEMSEKKGGREHGE